MFLLVGMVYERSHTRMIADLSGISKAMPVAGGMLAFASFASLGLPGLAGFPGEFLSLLGAWDSPHFSKGFVVASAIGVLLAAAYMLWMVQRVVLGNPSPTIEGLPDLNVRELTVLAPLVALTVVIGVYWSSILQFIDPAVTSMLKAMGA